MAEDCKIYLTDPKDLLDNYTNPTGQLDNYAGSKASKNVSSSKRSLIFSNVCWPFRPAKISLYLARLEEPVNDIFYQGSNLICCGLWPQLNEISYNKNTRSDRVMKTKFA